MPTRTPDEVAHAVAAVVGDARAPGREAPAWRWLAPLEGDRIAHVADERSAWECLRREGGLLDAVGRALPGRMWSRRTTRAALGAFPLRRGEHFRAGIVRRRLRRPPPRLTRGTGASPRPGEGDTYFIAGFLRLSA